MADAFADHDINHLSPSSLNTYVANPAYWVVNYCIMPKTPFIGNPAMWRGTAIEAGLVTAGMNHDVPVEQCLEHALRVYDDEVTKAQAQDAKIDMDKWKKEREFVKKAVPMGAPTVRSWGTPSNTQKRVKMELEGIGVPIIGYTDVQYEDAERVRDFKTAASLPTKAENIKPGYCRQLAFYGKATGKQPWVDYVSSKEIRSYAVPDVDYHFSMLVASAHALKNFLSKSKDPRELARTLFPDFESFYWGDDSIAIAKEVWNLK